MVISSKLITALYRNCVFNKVIQSLLKLYNIYSLVIVFNKFTAIVGWF